MPHIWLVYWVGKLYLSQSITLGAWPSISNLKDSCESIGLLQWFWSAAWRVLGLTLIERTCSVGGAPAIWGDEQWRQVKYFGRSYICILASGSRQNLSYLSAVRSLTYHLYIWRSASDQGKKGSSSKRSARAGRLKSQCLGSWVHLNVHLGSVFLRLSIWVLCSQFE